ncbi:3419_t:CDS:2 [Paraglomus occultum]|uniref:3419_t:CDS:1 n=1 Tax=Paraglomus occultum TaxID=144539 RepID=A0A9N9CUC8_9GLOM|nr:3419_t:CDS:2 [Paraglomus occultum]
MTHRPARQQVDSSVLFNGRGNPPEGSGTFYNIWYNRWSGGDRSARYAHRGEKAKTRCVPSRDAGATKADKMPNTYFCLYFARGCCPFGYECSYWHRIPNENDLVDATIDCFGRDKFNEYRDDMGGVGSFNRENRTIYVGHIHLGPDMEEIVRKHFSEWGEIDKIKILKDKGVAFVTYKSSLNAEFAKEAMSCQSLDHDEVLNVRWATDDPNPRAKAEYKRKAELMAAQAIQKNLPAEFTLMQTDNYWKRARYDPDGENYGLEGYQTPAGFVDTTGGGSDLQDASTQSVELQPQLSTGQVERTLISNETLQALKALSQTSSISINKKNDGKKIVAKEPDKNENGGGALSGLAAYEVQM